MVAALLDFVTPLLLTPWSSWLRPNPPSLSFSLDKDLSLLLLSSVTFSLNSSQSCLWTTPFTLSDQNFPTLPAFLSAHSLAIQCWLEFYFFPEPCVSIYPFFWTPPLHTLNPLNSKPEKWILMVNRIELCLIHTMIWCMYSITLLLTS